MGVNSSIRRHGFIATFLQSHPPVHNFTVCILPDFAEKQISMKSRENRSIGSGESTSLADPRGRPRGSKFSLIHAVFGKNLKNNSNFGSWRINLGKILGPPLYIVKFGRAIPPPRAMFFQFHAFFGKFGEIVCWRPTPTPRVGAPTSRKFWICHWSGNIVCSLFLKTAWKWKNLDRGGRASLPPPWILQWYGDTEDNVQTGVFTVLKINGNCVFPILNLKLG